MGSMLKKLVVFLLVLLACAGSTSAASAKDSLVILYLGNADGYVDGCG